MQSFNQHNMTFPCSSRVINMQLIGNWNTPISCLQSLHFPTVKMLSEHLMLCLQSAALPWHGERGDPPAFWWGEGWSISEKLCKVCKAGNQPCSRFGGRDKPGRRGQAAGRQLHPRFISLPPGNWAFETVDFASVSVTLHNLTGPGTLVSSGFVFAWCGASSRELGSVHTWLPGGACRWLPWSWGHSGAPPELGHPSGSPALTGWAIAVLGLCCNGPSAKLACAFCNF